MERTEIGNRLKKLRKSHKLSQIYVAEKLFISQAGYSLIEKGKNSVSPEHLIRLSQLYNKPANYFLTGNEKVVYMNLENGFLPLINAKAHAGFLKNAHEEKVLEDFEFYKIPGFNPTKDSLLIEIEGNSMQPTVIAGDVLICQPQKNLEHVLDGSIVILVTEGELLTTRLFKHEDNNYFRMKGDNFDEEDKKEIRKSEIIKLLMVLGKVSSLLIPHKELVFKGRLKTLEESVEFLNKRVYQMEKLVKSRR